jgi:hypothetical protein
MDSGHIRPDRRKTAVRGTLLRNDELQLLIEEIKLFIQYAVTENDREKAYGLVEKYRDNRVALRALKEYYSVLPEAREEPVLSIARIDIKQGVFLLGLSAGAHEYIFFATEDDAGYLGEYHEGMGDQEILGFFGYADKEEFLQLHPTMAEFDDFGETWKINSVLCPVCLVPVGEYHHLGCPVEVCPWCLGQLRSCSCRFEQTQSEEFEDDEDLTRFETLLQQKGRIPFETGQGPSYPIADNGQESEEK